LTAKSTCAKLKNKFYLEREMKKFIMILVLSLSVTGLSFSQENNNISQENNSNSTNLYTLFFNVVNEQFKFPLVGFVNIAAGNHNSPQIGFVNWNTKDFSTVQLGFVNTAGGNMAGFQMGFVNTTAGDASGFQTGFVSTAANKLDGVQISFVNIAKQTSGLQLGFINYADSFQKGIPVGFLSIIRNGGYKAVEFGVSDVSPFNVSFKIGVEAFYTSFSVSYNPFRDGIREQIICGAGLGSIIKLGKTFFINPEITSYHATNESFQHYTAVVPYFGYKITPNLSAVAGPSIVWISTDKNTESPFYNIVKHSINDTNELYLGARTGIRLSW
jgi:hypothetical protein